MTAATEPIVVELVLSALAAAFIWPTVIWWWRHLTAGDGFRPENADVAADVRDVDDRMVERFNARGRS